MLTTRSRPSDTVLASAITLILGGYLGRILDREEDDEGSRQWIAPSAAQGQRQIYTLTRRGAAISCTCKAQTMCKHLTCLSLKLGWPMAPPPDEPGATVQSLLTLHEHVRAIELAQDMHPDEAGTNGVVPLGESGSGIIEEHWDKVQRTLYANGAQNLGDNERWTLANLDTDTRARAALSEVALGTPGICRCKRPLERAADNSHRCYQCGIVISAELMAAMRTTEAAVAA